MSEVSYLAFDKERAGTSPAQSTLAGFTTTPAKFQSTPSFWRGTKSTRLYCGPGLNRTTTQAKNECYDLSSFLVRGKGYGQSNWIIARITVDEKSAVASLLCCLCTCFCACCDWYVFSLLCAQRVVVAADVTLPECLERVVPRGIDGGFRNGDAKL